MLSAEMYSNVLGNIDRDANQRGITEDRVRTGVARERGSMDAF